jgi:hypothetical protein
VAQLGARLDGIEEVVGSNPIGSTNSFHKLLALYYSIGNIRDWSRSGYTLYLPMHFYLYILRSEGSGRFYIGQTKDLAQRVAYHNASYSKSLKNREP